ncbi:MAG: four helix bundle protein [Flavobacteriales bacterium]|nr:four helix bundle protein [Flavobacteriales bacterium]
MHQFEKLHIWQEGIELVAEIYQVTKTFPKEEMFGLTSQMRRSAVSIPTNIAEGACRNNVGEFRHFLGIAAGSTAELITLIHLAEKISLLDLAKADQLIEKLRSLQNRNFTLQQKVGDKKDQKQHRTG